MSSHLIGSVWSVPGLEEAVVVILAGPFAADRGAPEYLVAPFYTGQEPGFVWTSEDVRLEVNETGLGEARFAGIWNARPLLQQDLGLQVGTLTEEATIAVRDAYWASLNERPLGPSPKLGRPIQSADEPAAQFQMRELERWEPLSGRVFVPVSDGNVTNRYSIGGVWTLTPEDVDGLSKAMDATDGLLGMSQLEAIGGCKALFTTTVSFWPGTGVQQDLFTAAHAGAAYWWTFAHCGVTLDAKGRKELEDVPIATELSKAA